MLKLARDDDRSLSINVAPFAILDSWRQSVRKVLREKSAMGTPSWRDEFAILVD
jgi:hypothetical protein